MSSDYAYAELTTSDHFRLDAEMQAKMKDKRGLDMAMDAILRGLI